MKISFAIILMGSLIWGDGQSQASLSQQTQVMKNQVSEEANAVKKQTTEEKQHGLEIDQKLALVAPFVKIDKNKLVTIDKNAAKEAKVPVDAIKLAEKLYDEQNKIITEISKNGRTFDEISISKDILNQFDDYFKFVKGGRNAEPDTDKVIINPELVRTEVAGGCGGDQDNPHPCPDRQYLYWFFSLSDLQQKFYDQGYHATSSYAGGAAPWNPARDFTKCVNANNCVPCAFRYQGVIADSSISGQYNGIVQVPEPNPEVLEYVWPTSDWGIYVKWWHENPC